MFTTTQRAPRSRLASAGLGAAAIMTLMLSACAPPGGTAGPAPTDAPTELPTEDVVLRLADNESEDVYAGIEAAQKQFTAEHPNITFKRASATPGDYNTKMKLALGTSSAPDVLQVSQAQVMMGPVVASGLVRDLSAYADAYGWEEVVPEGIFDQNRMSDDGKTMGEGGLYAISLGGNMVGVYYNRAKFEELGFDAPPQTLAEFDEMLAAAKDAGEVPIQGGNLEKWPGNHYFSSLVSAYMEPGALQDWVFGKEGATIETPEAEQALEHLKEWGAAGYFNDSINGTAYSDANNEFIKGTGVFNITGSWQLAQYDNEAPGEIGFFLLPPAEAGAQPRATGALAPGYGISSRSENPAAGAAYLNYLLSEEATAEVAAVGVLPVREGFELDAPEGSTLSDVFAGWQSAIGANGLTLYPDWPTPSMQDELGSVQSLVVGDGDPLEILSAMQANWADFHGGN